MEYVERSRYFMEIQLNASRISTYFSRHHDKAAHIGELILHQAVSNSRVFQIYRAL